MRARVRLSILDDLQTVSSTRIEAVRVGCLPKIAALRARDPEMNPEISLDINRISGCVSKKSTSDSNFAESETTRESTLPTSLAQL